MLSSVAERLFWMARYLERAEDTARLANAYTQFILDTPEGNEPGWRSLVDILDAEQTFEQRYKIYNERNVVKFLLADKENLGSICHSIRAARENFRTTRDVLPEECWELVNELYIFVNTNVKAAINRRERFAFLDEVVSRSMQINGLIESSLSRDQAYYFMRMGKHFERADMTSRVVDVATANAQMQRDSEEASTWLWGHLLKSLSAITAYRRQIGPVVEANDVVNFLFKDNDFPGSLHFCLKTILRDSKAMKNHQAVEKLLISINRKLQRFEANKFSLEDLHLYIDKFQEQLNRLNFLVYQSWFSR